MSNENGMDNALKKAKDQMEKGVAEKTAEDAVKEATAESLKLVESCSNAMVGSIGSEGYPNIKAMIKCEAEGLKTFWFSTNTSSRRVAQFRQNDKACIYFVDQDQYKGLMLVGKMEILSDHESKARLWQDGCEIYYPLGVDDPDYSVFRFTAEWGNYYHGLINITFEV
ncbi:MAG TPA: pyridoxamine 5'-phosphate oxidase family protein [Clostridia bacterium]|nr:pyridoxamine 5'-phosphate oxidase family protein [Clostridia bacterium]